MATEPRPLPPRYQRVAALLERGSSVADIAAHLRVKESTAGYYVGRVRAHQAHVKAAIAGVRPQLSPRETQVAAMLDRGMSDAAIAAQLGIGVRTVESYVSRILRASGIPTRKEFVRHRNPTTGLGALSFRELEILHLIARGLSHGQVAQRLNIGQRTVEDYALAIRRKLRVPGHKSLARFGMGADGD